MGKLLASLRLGPLGLLLLAGLCFASGYWASRYGQLPSVMQRTDTRRLQQLVRTAESVASREAEAVAAQVVQGPYSFDKLLATSTYPTFVLQNGQLRYWSDATLRPEVSASTGPTEQMVETSFGHFLVLRRQAGQWTVVTYLPLERHYGISNRYLRAGSAQALFQGLHLRVTTDSLAHRLAAFQSESGHYLFSIQQLQPNPLTGQYVPLALLLLGIACYGAGWLWLARRWWQAGRAGAALATLATALLGLRGALLYLGLPFSFIELPLFDPRIYAASWLAPSLGDLLLNAGLVLGLAVGMALLWQRKRRHLALVAPRTSAGKAWVLVALAVAFGGLLLLLFFDYQAMFSSAQLSLDVTRGVMLTSFRALLVLALLLETSAYVIIFFALAQLGDALLRHLPKGLLLLALSVGAALALALGIAVGQPLVLLAGILLTFGALVLAVRLRPANPAGGYQLGVLGGLLLALTSATGAVVLHRHFEQQVLLDKQRLANNLLIGNDFQAELLLSDRLHKIATDPIVQQALTGGAFSRADAARRRVNRRYLSDYFDKYESHVTLYDAAGQPIGAPPGAPSMAAVQRALRRTAARTDQPGLYLLRSANLFGTRRYVALATVGGPSPGHIGPALGTVSVELTLKKLTSYSVLPELLIDQKFSQPTLANQLSYAGYDHNRLVYSEGDFDYANNLPATELAAPRLYTTGLVQAGFQHLAVRGTQGRTVVVTTATYSLADWLANFSFQFLLSALFWLLVGAGYLLWRGQPGGRLRLNFSARIQLLLNVGVVVPLLVVSVATASQLIASYQRDLIRTYERRGHLVLENLRPRRHLLADTTAQPVLEALSKNIAALTETDVNLYNARGELLASSQPLIFEAGLLGPLLNPQAVATLRERGAQQALLTEQAGSLAFTTLYLPVRASAGEVADSAGYPLAGHTRRARPALPTDDTVAPTGPIVGYVGTPFFDSAKNLNIKLTGLFKTLLNIFTLMFLLFLGLAFLAARQLTAPLKLIAQRLTRTTLTGENQPLPYRSSDDEIGLLVHEYNAMLTKLEASRRELAAQEKEVAWREMARQVAHEIKNPLTPMKLSLQFLQKAINERRPNAEELIGRISQTLITQVDVLSDIATSFSTFTNLPAMRPERLNVAEILRRCAGLHQPDAADGMLELHLPADADGGRYVVYADENLLVRTFNNLLINARQAVPEGRVPHLTVALEAVGPGVQVMIRDNGAGIAAEVREKVFVPNFTTKASGSGIGLAVAKRGIESAGGRIWFETAVGEGTAFFVELPLAG